MQHLLQHFLRNLSFCLCAQTLFPAGIDHFHFMDLGASGNTYDGDILLAQLSGLLFCCLYYASKNQPQRTIR